MNKKLLVLSILPIAILTSCGGEPEEDSGGGFIPPIVIDKDVEIDVDGEDFNLTKDLCANLYRKTFNNGLLTNAHYELSWTYYKVNNGVMDETPSSVHNLDVKVDRTLDYEYLKFTVDDKGHIGKTYIYDRKEEETYVSEDDVTYQVSEVKYNAGSSGLGFYIDRTENNKTYFNCGYSVNDYSYVNHQVITASYYHDVQKVYDSTFDVAFNEAKTKAHFSRLEYIRWYETYAIKEIIEIIETGNVKIELNLPKMVTL